MKNLNLLGQTDSATHGWLRRLVRRMALLVKLAWHDLGYTASDLALAQRGGSYKEHVKLTMEHFERRGAIIKSHAPNIPSSATPQAGLEPRKRNGGEQ
jgi:hypothetical protein